MYWNNLLSLEYARASLFNCLTMSVKRCEKTGLIADLSGHFDQNHAVDNKCQFKSTI